MKKYTFLLSILSLITAINAQTVTGKLVNQAGQELSGMQLKLYIQTKVYDAISGTDGSFNFNNVSDVKDEGLPTEYSISENYPNPFNPKTRILFSVPVASKLNISVFNLLGQKVLEDIQKEVAAGNGYLDLELQGLPNGIYFARLVFDDKYVAVRKLMLLYGSQHLNVGNNEIHSLGTTTGLNKKSANVRSKLIIDSLVVTGISIKKNMFNKFDALEGNQISLGEVFVNTTTSGVPCPGTPTVKYEGKVYNTVYVGNQCWLKENLDVGNMIQGNQNPSNNNTIEKYCYDNKTENCNKYGGLYQWNEAMAYSTMPGTKGICPEGFHIPTKLEFETLADPVSYKNNGLKAIGQGTESGIGTNTSGFSALLAGYRGILSTFHSFGYDVLLWSSTAGSSNGAYGMALWYKSWDIWVLNYYKDNGFSVRCIKN